MFHAARLKMTAWYVLIVMILSILFSLGMYVLLRREVERFSQGQRLRITRALQDQGQFMPYTTMQPVRFNFQVVDPVLEEETIERIQFVLIGVNIGILILSSGLCYLLAGSTLAPIQEMVEEQRRFISDASHEFKTPLTSMRTTLEVELRNNKLNLVEAKQLMQDNLQEVVELQTLNEALLKLDAYQKHKNGRHFELVKLDAAAKAAIKKITPLAKQKKITIQAQFVPATVMGNLAQLTELSVILLDNAVKYSPEHSSITVATTEQRHHAQLQIIDNGVGIPTAQLPHIFDRFYRVDASRTKNQVSGYGLGLAVARQIAELHDGKLSVKSEVGRGTTFTLSLGKREG